MGPRARPRTAPDRTLAAVTGAPFEAPEGPLAFRIDADGPTTNVPLPDDPVTFADIEPLLTARCAQCHGNTEAWPFLVPMTPEALNGQPSEQVPALLVRPGDPYDSYLMHKLIPDYPVRRNGPHPPPWGEDEPWEADATPLTTEELWLIERWIAGGAR